MNEESDKILVKRVMEISHRFAHEISILPEELNMFCLDIFAIAVYKSIRQHTPKEHITEIKNLFVSKFENLFKELEERNREGVEL